MEKVDRDMLQEENDLLLKQKRKLEETLEKTAQEKHRLQRAFSTIFDVVLGSLIALDWAVKLGVVVGVWFFPLPQERSTQAIALGAYALVVTLISVGLRNLKEIEKERGY